MATDKEIEAAADAILATHVDAGWRYTEMARAALTAAEQVRASEPTDGERLRAALNKIAALGEPSSRSANDLARDLWQCGQYAKSAIGND